AIPEGFAWDVANNIPDLHNVVFNIESTDGTDLWTSTMSVTGHAPQLNVGGISIVDADPGNGNGSLDPGETVDIIIELYNNGSYIAAGTDGTLTSSNEFVTINNTYYNIGDVESETMSTATFSVTVAQGTPVGEIIVFEFVGQSGEYVAESSFSKASGLIVEDWESGDMNQFNWETGGNANWIVSTQNPYEGTYCNQSGNINDSQLSYLSIDYEVMADDTLSFYAMVSSEPSYDFMKFYVDGQLTLNWSGEVSWRRIAIPIGEGTHNFKWEYKKDVSVSGGDDCARVDYIVLPVPPITAAFAGADADFCETDFIVCSGSATYCDSTRWVTSGTGIFSDEYILTPIYQPSDEDIDAGNVTLTFTGYGPIETISDDVVFNIAKTPVAYSGDNGSVCSDVVFNMEAAYAENFVLIEWTTLGDGTFDDANAVNPNYTVGPTDIENGVTSLLMTVLNGEACEAATSEFELLVATVTLANAGADADICSMLTYTLEDAIATDYSEIIWTTTGDGSFDDATSVNPTYSPGENDKETKEVTLTLTATSETICPTIVDEMLLTLYCTDIADVNSLVVIELYPNPNNGEFTLKLEGVVYESAIIRIFNGTGKVVYEESDVQLRDNYSNNIELGVQPGIYTLRIEGDITNISKKFIVR
ncbi:MAG: T9SS type A sorting domain-containing protein, partial [Bacteroidota bacterium]